MERLDRGVCNVAWRSLFPDAVINHLCFWGSDHRPLVLYGLEGVGLVVSNGGRPRGRFYFEECWVNERECCDIVQASWNGTENSGGITAVLSNIVSCRKNLC